MEGVDAGYLYLETPSMHMHTLKIAVIEPPEPFALERFSHEVISRLERLPPLRRRVLPTPLGLFHPVWVGDRPLDPAYHFFHREVPAPGGMRGLEALIGEVAGRPLDRSRPLWEMHFCEPFDDGRVAVVVKMHHALADGVAANALLLNVVDDPSLPTPEPATGAPPDSALEPTPSRQELFRAGLLGALRQLLDLPALLRRTASAVASVLRHRRVSEVAVPRPVLDVPRTPFNAALTPRRSFATCTLPLTGLKEVARAHGVTLNDVVLAVVSGAVRRVLLDAGALPPTSLVAGVPVATDAPGGADRLGGNRVSNLFTSLATDVEDPGERLRAISRVTTESKTIQRTLGADMLVDWVQFAPPAPLAAFMRLYSRTGLASRHPAPFNLVVSNVRGPAAPASIAGARLLDLFSVGPILEGIGLNVTAWSYVDRMNFSVLGCPDLVPDLAPLVAALPQALEELQVSSSAL